VPKTEFASQNWYDVWFPNLAPSVETMKLGQNAKTPPQWARFVKKYRAEMAFPRIAKPSSYSRRFPGNAISRSAATAKTKHIATVRFCANYWLTKAQNWNLRL
jgi:uncharacterized protein YeaO (DUF488 family)